MPDAFQMPDDLKGKSAEDIAQLYVSTKADYDKFKGEWEPRSKDWEAWSELGKPDELKQVVNWAKTVAAPIVQRIAKGEAYLLNDADYKAYKGWADKTGNGTRQAADAGGSSADDDLYAPIKKSLAEELKAELNRLVDERAKTVDAGLKQFIKTTQDQLNLFGHVQKLQRQNPNLDFDQLLQKAAARSTMTAEQLLNELIDSEGKLSGMEAEIEKRVAAKLAEAETAKENARTTTLLETRRLGGNLPINPPKRTDVTKALVSELGKKFPGIYDQIPLA
jgi:hypothetical protein